MNLFLENSNIDNDDVEAYYEVEYTQKIVNYSRVNKKYNWLWNCFALITTHFRKKSRKYFKRLK